jgi:hypothetical protein
MSFFGFDSKAAIIAVLWFSGKNSNIQKRRREKHG